MSLFPNSAGAMSGSPGRNAQPRSFLPLSEDVNPMVTHGSGTLKNLIRSTSFSQPAQTARRSSSAFARDLAEDEEATIGSPAQARELYGDNYRKPEERRASLLLNGPQMRSMRLIGNSNPRYRWQQYWKTEEELKTMKKPMYVHEHAIL